MLHEAGLGGGVGDEGGYAPNLKTRRGAAEYIVKAIEKAGYKPGDDFMFAMDAAHRVVQRRDRQMYQPEGRRS